MTAAKVSRVMVPAGGGGKEEGFFMAVIGTLDRLEESQIKCSFIRTEPRLSPLIGPRTVITLQESSKDSMVLV